MEATTPQESGQAGEQETPTPEFSDAGASSTSVDADAIVSKLIPTLEQLVERKVQSTKDKRLSKIEKALGGRLDLLAELEEMGTEIPKEVRSEMRLRELEERLTQSAAQPAQVRDDGSSQAAAAVTEAIAELNKVGLDPNDAEFLGLLRGKYANRAEFDLKVQRHIVGKLAPQKPANPADVVQSPVKSGAQDKSLAQLETEYQAEATKIAQTMRGDQKHRALASLKAKYREAGLPK